MLLIILPKDYVGCCSRGASQFERYPHVHASAEPLSSYGSHLENKMEDHGMRTFIVDSFTDTPFKGNPAGVCIIGSQLSDERMLHIAQELNLSETAFLSPLESGGAFAIRYFSPKMEIPLCGHATLASAKVYSSTSAAITSCLRQHSRN